ncbi:DUF2750 domain-containing protein [Endozoicomonas sp. G2_1]|uniref:DUF2750 domain-containing protein n=1 Tax=Endozoicomonas sp. G2_1 TaxID=2821091 RepID=UPI001ADC505F|nr:DUF2750 domain-containing protein [Endozoicomonas sp. G2_1]MBO9489770.1 DUF2750 domain-containing protein [Endozoicomonas sp. G2_1]
MNQPLTAEQLKTISQYNVEQRYQYLLKEVVSQRQVWILTDEHGCVMLNTEDEDCVPVWPSQAFAESWATGDWQDCKPEAISLNKWHSRWTQGLLDDELAIVAFPNEAEEGLVVFPDEFDFDLNKQARKTK